MEQKREEQGRAEGEEGATPGGRELGQKSGRTRMLDDEEDASPTKKLVDLFIIIKNVYLCGSVDLLLWL